MMQYSGFTEIILLECTLTVYGQYPAFLHPETLQSTESEVAAVGIALIGVTCLN